MKDSSSLRSIALLTLIFLPVTTIATFYGAEFIYMTEDEEGSRRMHIHSSGWIVLASATLVTFVLVLAWFFHLSWLDKRFARGRVVPPSMINPPSSA